jgi:tetratricopeptide (TPR) repeat protein
VPVEGLNASHVQSLKGAAPPDWRIGSHRRQMGATMPKKSANKPRAIKAKADVTPVTMEVTMRQLAQMLEAGDSSEMITKGDLHALITSLGGPSASDRLSDAEADAKDEAQQIAFDAMEAKSETEARKLAKRALRLDTDCVDALVVMTELDAHIQRERIEGLQKAVVAGERSLGEKFIHENKGHFWLLIETRPYMRAMAQLAEALSGEGISLDAIKIYEKMLELNPNDNQGVRDPLLGLYIAIGDLKGAGRLLKKYKKEATAYFEWARVLERFLAGDRDGASKVLKVARKANRHVEFYLTQKRPLPKELPETYSPGSEEEAVLVLSYLSGALVAQQEACFWLLDLLAAKGMH